MFTVVAIGLSLAPAPLRAQWHAEARVGRLDFRLEPQAVPITTSVGVGLGYTTSAASLRLSAGVPLGEEDPLWGAVEASRRLAVEHGPFTLGVDVAAQGFLQRYARRLEEPGGLFEPPAVIDGHETGYGIAAQVLPVAAVRIGPATLQARGGESWYRTALGDREATRRATVAELQVALQPTASLLLTAAGRQYWADARAYRYAGISAAWALPALTLWGSAGAWLEPSGAPVPWSAGIAVPFAQRFEVSLQARADGIDPLYGSAPRRTWTAGLRIDLGDADQPAAPVPASYQAGRATIELPASAADGEPRIAGDFNGWTPQRMTRTGDAWTFVVALEPGVYEYAFVDQDGTWFVPPSTPGRREDGMGGHVALLVVGGAQ